jgi:hypothetical protein
MIQKIGKEAEKFSNCSDGISYICSLCSNNKGNMEKKYNTPNEMSHTTNSDMAFDYSGDDMEQTRNLKRGISPFCACARHLFTGDSTGNEPLVSSPIIGDIHARCLYSI